MSAALADWGGRHSLRAAASRQLAPAAQLAGSEHVLAGTSSFGMSGVNAHALLSAAGSLAAAASSSSASGSVAACWQRSSYWPSPARHPLLLLAASRGQLVECAVDLSAAGLAWLRDHAVQGRPLLPAAAMFELAAAVAAALLPQDGSAGGAGGAALAGLSIPAPCFLPDQAGPAALLRASVNRSSGALEVLSARGACHLQASAAAVPAGMVPAGSVAGWRQGSSGLSALPQPGAAARGHNFAQLAATRQETAG